MTSKRVLDALETSERIDRAYRGYLKSTFQPRRPDLVREFGQAVENAELTKGVFLEASAPFEQGATVRDLVEEGVLSQHFLRFPDDVFPIDRALHAHQESAIRKALAGRNLIVSTGTGSGKTEAFLIPILDGLFREVDGGTIATPGVRALLLYPMNALANDQVKRLRRLLKPFPEVTFGRYVGETRAGAREAEADFAKRYPTEPRIKNELLSRSEMQEAPPTILLTNYAMLEYLLLRPADSPFFDGDEAGSWRQIVLDEAHTYDGAQGTEVAMLLRRVRDRIHESEVGRLQCFATSATLGRGRRDYPKLINFATQLFGEPFHWADDDEETQDIVEARRRSLIRGDTRFTLPQEDWGRLQKAFRAGASSSQLAEIVSGAAPDSESRDGEDAVAYLGRLLGEEATVIRVQERLTQGALSVRELADEVFLGETATSDLIKLVDLAVAARTRADDASLIPARYHFWVGSLEGGYLCLHPQHPEGHGRLQLGRHEHCPHCKREGRRSHMVEIGVCRSCGAEYAVGRIRGTGLGDQLQHVSDRERAPEYFLIGDIVDGDVADDDAEVMGESGRAAGVPQLLDAEIGILNSPGKPVTSEAGPQVRVTKIERADQHEPLHRCAVCSSSVSGEVVFRLLTGVDAPVSVIATELYQSLPPSSDPKQRAEIGEGRKLLSFADSRQDAAYFAPYLRRTYERAVVRGLVFGAIVGLHSHDEVPRFDDVVEDVRRRAEESLLLDPDKGRLSNIREATHWVAQESLALDRRQSLDGLGLVDIRMALPRRYQPPPALTELGLSADDATSLTQTLLDTLRLTGAVSLPDGLDIRHARFAPRNVEVSMRERGSEYGILAWLPGGYASNRRVDILRKLFEKRGISANPIDALERLWAELSDPNGPWGATLASFNSARNGVTFKLNHERLEFAVASPDHSPMRCSNCRRIWWRSVDEVCPSWRCQGPLRTIDDPSVINRNHYARLYRELDPIGMSVEEHTAQWKADTASRIQDEFVRGKRNVLSCSTTFEMGVDVGDVQAVLMRNVPPRVSNYVQRAGRAGRRQDSAAFVLTMAQRRSHDRSFFADPSPMVNGQIDPPVIQLDNVPILRRHAHSVAFAAFQRHRVDTGDDPLKKVGEFFAGKDPGVEVLRVWLGSQPTSVKDALQRVLPPTIAKEIDVDRWGWVSALFERDVSEPTFGWMGRATEEIREDLEQLEKMATEAFSERQGRRGAHLDSVREELERRDLLGFLASRNILPKYGFPVDVVQLDLRDAGAKAKNLELDRDLRLAIGDYAPGGVVVAGGELWKAEGIRHGHGGDQLARYHWSVCKECDAFRSALERIDLECTVCGSPDSKNAGSFVTPRHGFVGSHGGEPGDSRPMADRRIRTWFGSYRDAPPELTDVPELSEVLTVRARASGQGRIVTINEGPATRGYRFCRWCGRGEPAPSGKTRTDSKEHEDLRRPGKSCGGTMMFAQLGHDYLTDVLEIRVEGTARSKYGDSAMQSVLSALLAGATRLGISRDDIDGTLHSSGRDTPQAVVIFDAVPGGAGHSQLLLEKLPELFAAALDVVSTCDCEETSSCYGCLRTYRNQYIHDDLSRGDAKALLTHLLGQGAHEEFDLFSPIVHELLNRVLALGASMPAVGLETESGHLLEMAWSDERVAVLLDGDEDRDVAVAGEGWLAFHVHEWIPEKLVDSLEARRP